MMATQQDADDQCSTLGEVAQCHGLSRRGSSRLEGMALMQRLACASMINHIFLRVVAAAKLYLKLRYENNRSRQSRIDNEERLSVKEVEV
jgi:hypothetical protein